MNPFLIVGHTNLSMKRKIKDLLQKEKFDVLHAETFYIMQNIPKTKIPIVLAEHNIEYMVYKRFADSKPFFIKLPFYVDVIKMKRLEENFWKKADKNTTNRSNKLEPPKNFLGRISNTAFSPIFYFF